MKQQEINVELQARLDELKPVPARDTQKTARGRANFLNEAMKIEERVSGHGFFRHSRWIPIGKEKFAMNVLISAVVVAGLLFGGGVTVKAAQDDLPGQPLYGIKTASEDVSLQFRNNPEEKVARLMELTQTRIEEMSQLIDSGKVPPDQVRSRMEQHLRDAMQICASMDDATLDRTLSQVRDQLRQQDRDMEQLQLHASADVQPLLERTRTTLQLRLHLAEDGLLNHEQFRHTVRNGFQNGQTATPVTPNQEQNGQPTSSPNGPSTNPGDPNTNPGGPNADATPGPTNGNGAGNGTGTGSDSGNGSSGGSGSGGNNTGGNGTGGTGTGGSGTGGSGTGGSGTGGNRP